MDGNGRTCINGRLRPRVTFEPATKDMECVVISAATFIETVSE